MAILFITHDIALARKVSDRLAVMLKGKIVEEGSAGGVTTAPIHPYTMRLLEVAPDLDPKSRGMSGPWAVPEGPTIRAREF